jgi:hypothetical protein
MHEAAGHRFPRLLEQNAVRKVARALVDGRQRNRYTDREVPRGLLAVHVEPIRVDIEFTGAIVRQGLTARGSHRCDSMLSYETRPDR